jgi:hypothetical protein
MRENRPYGSEGGGTDLNRSSLPLSKPLHFLGRYPEKQWIRSTLHVSLIPLPSISAQTGCPKKIPILSSA